MCARGSCFSEEVLSVDNGKLMAQRNFPVMIYYCENDLPGIRNESQRAIEWYRNLGFAVTRKIVPGKGHERVPDLAAAFFAQNTNLSRRTTRVEIESSGTVGMSPFTVNLLANLPGIPYDQYHTYKFSWYIDGQLQEQAQGAGKRMLFATIYTAGEHQIKVQVLPPEGQKIENTILVRVLPTVPKI